MQKLVRRRCPRCLQQQGSQRGSRSPALFFAKHRSQCLPSEIESATLVAEGKKAFGTDPLFCTQVGPVLGAHLGSGMLVGGIGCAPATH